MSVGLKAMQIGVGLVLIVPMLIFDAGELGYTVMNAIGMGLNLLVMVSFLVTFFYLNFKMTGIMMETRLNAVIRRIYKIQLIILISRAVALAFQIVIALYVFPGTFQQKIDEVVA